MASSNVLRANLNPFMSSTWLHWPINPWYFFINFICLRIRFFFDRDCPSFPGLLNSFIYSRRAYKKDLLAIRSSLLKVCLATSDPSSSLLLLTQSFCRLAYSRCYSIPTCCLRILFFILSQNLICFKFLTNSSFLFFLAYVYRLLLAMNCCSGLYKF